jgi:CRP-like cAMP-binding protein
MIKEKTTEPMLFSGMTATEIEACLTALQAKKKTYRKGETILHAGSTTESMGLVLSGSVTIESNDVWGNRSILSNVSEGQVFAETYALLSDQPLLVDVTANEECRILMMKISKLKKMTEQPLWAMKFHRNLLTITARKNLMLSERSFHVSSRTIRDRVLSYLNAVALQTGSKQFEIPFDRQQLADYLNVERTALSKELGAMKREGIIDARKSRFTLLV